MTAALKVFVCSYLDAQCERMLKESLADCDLCILDNASLSEKVDPGFLDAEVVFGNVPPSWLSQGSCLRWMQLDSIGFDGYLHLDRASLPLGLAITNLRGMFREPTVETALAGILAHYRGIAQFVRLQPAKEWKCWEVRQELRLLHGNFVVIMGVGSIGKKVGDLLGAFNCRVVHFARETQDTERQVVRTLEELDGALSEADLLINCLPKTQETVGLLGRRRLELLKRGCLVVNIGRGEVFDEIALADQLNSGSLGGAVLDVFQSEPLPSDHPLWSCPNTMITHHTGGGYAEELYDKMAYFLNNLKRYRKGHELHNLIDWDRGY